MFKFAQKYQRILKNVTCVYAHVYTRAFGYMQANKPTDLYTCSIYVLTSGNSKDAFKYHLDFKVNSNCHSKSVLLNFMLTPASILASVVVE